MRIATVFNKFIELYEEAVKNPMVKKPISYALYFTWRWTDEREKSRDEDLHVSE